MGQRHNQNTHKLSERAYKRRHIAHRQNRTDKTKIVLFGLCSSTEHQREHITIPKSILRYKLNVELDGFFVLRTFLLQSKANGGITMLKDMSAIIII